MTLAARAALLTILLLIPAACGGANAPAAAPPKAAPCELVRVIDGDTIVVRTGGAEEHVRLLCIDTPERGEPGYSEATEALKNLLGRGAIRLESDPKHDDRDRYGRLLRYVWFETPGGWRLANLEIIRLGHSEYLTAFGKSSLYGKEFEAAPGLSGD